MFQKDELISKGHVIGSAPVANDGRSTIPINIREILKIEEGVDNLIFKIHELTNEKDEKHFMISINRSVIKINKGEKIWD